MWYVPVYEKDGKEYTRNGTDLAYHTKYVRADKVREFIKMVSRAKCIYGNTPVKVYALPDAKFWYVKLFDPADLAKWARLVWKK